MVFDAKSFSSSNQTAGGRFAGIVQGRIFAMVQNRGRKIEDVAQKIANEARIEKKFLFQRGRTKDVSDGKALLIHIGVEYMHKTRDEMAAMTKMSGPAASKARVRGRAMVRDPKIAKWLKVT